MKLTTKIISLFTCALLASFASKIGAAPLGTAFTYSGQLQHTGSPANIVCDFQFSLWDAATAGTQVGVTLAENTVGVSNGLFTVTLDFGGAAFTGDARWLQVAVRTNGVGGFAQLSPRQSVPVTPAALFAVHVAATNLLGQVSDWQLSTNVALLNTNAAFLGEVDAAAFRGDGSGLTNLDATQLATGTVPGPRLAGIYSNSVTFNNNGNSFGGSGADLTRLNASQLTVGTVPGAQLGGTYSNAVAFNNAGNSFSGNGGGLTSLNPVNLSAGTAGINITGHAATATTATNFAGTPVFTGGLTLQEGAGGESVWTVSVGSAEGPAGYSFSDALVFSADGVQYLALADGGGPVAFSDSLGANEVDCGELNVRDGDWETAVHIDPNGEINAKGNLIAGGFANIGLWCDVDGECDVGGNLEVTGNIWAGNSDIQSDTVHANAMYAGSYNQWTDSSAQEKAAPISGQQVLAQVTRLPIAEWSFKGDATTRHIGPTAQDFYAAFSLGADDNHIATVDAEGVALAAIQGLNEKLDATVKEKDARISALEKELTELKAVVNTLVQESSGGGQ